MGKSALAIFRLLSVTRRRLYEQESAAKVRGAHLQQLKKIEAKKTRAICAELGFPTLTLAELRSVTAKKGTTCFILGSGVSVNELSRQDMDKIAASFSIGINSWVSHSFVPDAYSFEADGKNEEPSHEIQTMSRALSKKANQRPDLMLLLLRPKRVELTKRLIRVPKSLRSRAFMYGRVNFQTRELRNLDRDLTSAFALEKRRPLEEPVVFDNGATVPRMTILAALAGFSEVVLVGVDLDSRGYFWESEEGKKANPDLAANFPRSGRVSHGTLATEKRPFSNLDFMPALARVLGQEFDVQVFAGSKASALADYIPVYNWGRDDSHIPAVPE